MHEMHQDVERILFTEEELRLRVKELAAQIEKDYDGKELVLASVLRLLDLYDEHRDALPRRNQFAPGRDLLLTAAVVARTPGVPLP